MKIEISKDKFLEMVVVAERFSSKHLTLPILSSILLTVEKNTLTVKATNLDVGIEFFTPIKTFDESWVVAVSPQSLKSFLSNVSGKNVMLELESNILHIKASESSASVTVESPEDFPIIPKVDDGSSLLIPSKVFVEGVNSVSYSASMSSIKPELSSIYVYPNNEEIVFVATDSFRLAEKKLKMSKKNISDPILIPFKNALEIAKVLEVVNDDVEIMANRNQISFTFEGGYISSRLVDGNFPDYKQIIPKEFVTEMVFIKDDFLKALKLTGGFVDKFQQVVCMVSPEDKKITLKTKGGVQGEASQNIKASGTGESIVITFNHKYLIDFIAHIKTDSIVMKLISNTKPVIMTESAHSSFTYLVMPMNR